MSEENKTLMEDLSESIVKHLPSQTADRLSEFIQQAKDDKEMRKHFAEKCDELRTDLDEARKELQKFNGREGVIASKEQEIKEKEEELNQREQQLKVDKAVLDATQVAANEKKEYCEGIVKAVFGNNRFKYEKTKEHTHYGKNEGDGYYNENGDWISNGDYTARTFKDKETTEGEN